MKKNIKNINKKLLTGAVVLTLLTTPLTGCETTTHFEYTTNQQGKSVSNNIMKYSKISNNDYKIIWLLQNGETSIYITKKEQVSYTNEGNKRYCYYDVFGIDIVYINDGTIDATLMREENLVDYLVNYNKVQQEYTEQEMKEILEQIKTDYEEAISKKLTKIK